MAEQDEVAALRREVTALREQVQQLAFAARANGCATDMLAELFRDAYGLSRSPRAHLYDLDRRPR